MRDTDELTDLLHTASRSVSPDLTTDPSLLISQVHRNHRRQRLVGLVAATVLALLGAATLPSLLDRDARGVDLAAGDAELGLKPGWTRLPDPPLSPRTDATVAQLGDEVVVAGGRDRDCPPGEGCAGGVPGASDGAAFNLRTRTWRPIPPAPAPVLAAPATVVDGAMILPSACLTAACQPSALQLLRYRPAGNAWDVLPGPPAAGEYTLVAVGRGLVAYDAAGAHPDWRLDPTSGRWVRLPSSPLPAGIGRQMVADGDGVALFTAATSPGSPVADMVVGARLDISSGTWADLPAAPGSRPTLTAGLEGVVILEDVNEGAAALYDPAAGSWKLIPAFPATASWRGSVAGVVRETTADFAAPTGWVLDAAAPSWIELPGHEGFDAGLGSTRLGGPRVSITSVGRRLFTFGGGSGLPGDLRNEAWVWTPPPARVEAVPPPTVAEVPPPTAPDPPATATTAPAATPTPGAPQFLSATGDAAAGRVTVRFDRPVVAGSDDKGPNGNNAPRSVLAAMSLIVFGGDSRCSSPAGNGHEYLAGVGTDSITTDATSLAPGTTYIGIAAGFVKSKADGTPNDPVVVKGGVPSGMFAGMSCIPIRVTGTPPTAPPPTAPPPGAPELVSAKGDAAAGRVTLRFSRPVVPGDGSGLGGPSAPPPGDTYMSAMQLVVHTTDSTCSSPNGNAHEYLSGVGTDTLTTDATSLVGGTTYISIFPGFAKSAAGGIPMKAVPCLAVEVTG